MTVHIPILVNPIVDFLLEPFSFSEKEPGWLVDCTLGGGGHTAAFLEAFEKDPALKSHRILAFDQDEGAIEKARLRFSSEITQGKLELIHCCFSEAASHLKDRKIFALMADLGFSSDQIEDPERGLSFQSDGPLDMRMNQTTGLTCLELLRQISERDLELIIREYGEERFSRRIASAIIEARRNKSLPQTTLELKECVFRAIPSAFRYAQGRGQRKPIHPATRTFQALRIAVNHEMEELDALLTRAILEVEQGGRVAILSFHSLEDRKVKQAFKQPPFHALLKKPLVATEQEVQSNPRARSAKLRVAERTA